MPGVGNAGKTTGSTRDVDMEEELRLFDSFPPAVRAAIRQSPVKFDMVTLDMFMKRSGLPPDQVAIVIMKRMRDLCRKDWLEEFGYGYDSDARPIRTYFDR